MLTAPARDPGTDFESALATGPRMTAGGASRTYLPWKYFKVDKEPRRPYNKRASNFGAHKTMAKRLTIAAFVALGLVIAGARNAEGSEINDCVNSYVSSYVQSSGGKYPPSGQAKKYCNCALASIASGDTMSKATGMCMQMIKNVYRLN